MLQASQRPKEQCLFGSEKDAKCLQPCAGGQEDASRDQDAVVLQS